jgi:hypothetical protein
MPSFVRNLLISGMGYGWIALLAGIGILGYAGYAQIKSSGENAFAQREGLQVIQGKVVDASEVTVTSKGRRGGGRVSDRYYELDVKPQTGESQKIRIALSVKKDAVSDLLNDNIEARFDKDNDNITYEIKAKGKDVLAYETTKQRLLAQAKADADSTSSASWLLSGVLLAALGALMMFFKGKLIAGIKEE